MHSKSIVLTLPVCLAALQKKEVLGKYFCKNHNLDTIGVYA
jgi:hypothetical protein